jgi:hypothetical protein
VAASENESEINAADYIPVVKKAVIGELSNLFHSSL